MPFRAEVRKSIAATAAAVLLALPSAPRAQLPFAVPVPAEVVAIPLLLLTIGVAALLRPDDRKRLHALEAEGRWDAIERLATQRIEGLAGQARGAAADAPASARAEHADALAQWYFVRAQARARQGRWAAAADDYGLASATSGGRLPAADLEQGLCLMTLRRWPQAEQAFERLAGAAPATWEPWYYLGVVRISRGDLDGARRAAHALRARDAARADALERDYLMPASSSPGADASGELLLADLPATGPDLAHAVVPGALVSNRIAIGAQALALPAGRWLLVALEPRPVAGRRTPHAVAEPELRVDALAGTAIALRGRRLHAAVVMHANLRSDRGVTNWSVAPCAFPDALLVERFARRFDTPECLALRRVTAAQPRSHGALAGAFAAAAAAGAEPWDTYVEVHYEHFAIDRFVSVSVLLPDAPAAGAPLPDAVAAQWARALADRLRDLARDRRREADLPAGPL